MPVSMRIKFMTRQIYARVHADKIYDQADFMLVSVRIKFMTRQILSSGLCGLNL